jgi:hypothetical protein
MRFKISDLCLAVIAVAIGSRLAVGVLPYDRAGPIDTRLAYALLMGSLVLCPLTVLKQVVAEHRRTSPRFGEWLWIIDFVWFLALYLCTLVADGGHVVDTSRLCLHLRDRFAKTLERRQPFLERHRRLRHRGGLFSIRPLDAAGQLDRSVASCPGVVETVDSPSP